MPSGFSVYSRTSTKPRGYAGAESAAAAAAGAAALLWLDCVKCRSADVAPPAEAAVHVRMCGCRACVPRMGARVHERVGAWVHVCMNAWAHGCMGARVHGRVGAWAHRCTCA
eukprot:356293-Chlamydomonas_euryale.AAC.6